MSQSLRDKLLIADTWPEKAAAIDEHVGTNIARLSTDANGNTVLVDSAGNILLTFDATGNIIAQITPRSDTLANLLLVADAGEGEIASATDADAIVKYLGGVGKAYYMSKEVGRLTIPFSSANIATDTPTTLLFIAASTDDLSVADAANDWFVVPAGVDTAEVFISTFGIGGAGTYRKIEAEYDVTGGGVWVPFPSILDVQANVATIKTAMQTTLRMAGLASYVGKRIRIRFTHDAGVTLNAITAQLRVVFYNYA